MKYLSQQLENKDSRERKEKNPLDFEQFGKYVSEAARKGSVTAQNHMKIWNNMNDASKAFKKNDFNGLVASLSKAIQINPLIVDIPSLYESKIEERIKTHSNELDTIICYIQMKSEKLCLSKLITDSFKKFPTNEYLTEVMCYNIVNVASPKDALKYINDVLKLHPASLHLLFCRVRICCMHILKTKEVLQASDEFLAIAPKDHPNVPACYYSKAEYHISTEDDLNFIKCFEAGVSAEKKQLPCFLPYNFEGRSLLEMAYGCIKSKLSIGKKSEGWLF
uniref:Uncharacterized protein n=1 Tax=Panagrolaimus superbus TaxID=310955 RepID=A0A914XW50_9BILA